MGGRAEIAGKRIDGTIRRGAGERIDGTVTRKD